MKLSVLIPVFNYPISKLLKDLNDQLNSLAIAGEIICLDDGSKLFLEGNLETANTIGVQYLRQSNCGRAFTRNKLSRLARGEWLLFLDCDSEIADGFLEGYLKNAESGLVLYGGTVYSAVQPEYLFVLHWKYGRNREALSPADRADKPYLSFKSNNFFLERELYTSIPMDQSIVEYGYEDLLWALQLKKKSIRILHLDNPVQHLGLDTADRFLKKTAKAMENLHLLLESNKLQGNETRLLSWYSRLSRWKLDVFFRLIISPLLPQVISNLKSSAPSMFLLDIYKLHLMILLAGKSKSKTQ